MKRYIRFADDTQVSASENELVTELKKTFEDMKREYPLEYIVEAYNAVIQSEFEN